MWKKSKVGCTMSKEVRPIFRDSRTALPAFIGLVFFKCCVPVQRLPCITSATGFLHHHIPQTPSKPLLHQLGWTCIYIYNKHLQLFLNTWILSIKIFRDKLPASCLRMVKFSGIPPMKTPVFWPMMVLPLVADADPVGRTKIWSDTPEHVPMLNQYNNVLLKQFLVGLIIRAVRISIWTTLLSYSNDFSWCSSADKIILLQKSDWDKAILPLVGKIPWDRFETGSGRLRFTPPALIEM